MIVKWVLAALGLSAPLVQDNLEVNRAIRRASAAAWQHGRANMKAQTAALDMIVQQEEDVRPLEMLEKAAQTREMIEQMLGRM